MADIEGIVTAIKLGGHDEDNVYTVVSDSVMQLKSSIRLELYDKVAIAEHGNGASEVRVLGDGKEEWEAAVKRLVDGIAIGEPSTRYLNGDAVAAMAKMAPALKDAAKTFITTLLSGAPILVRFHNDGDGGDGALALYRAVESLTERTHYSLDNVIWIMNPGVAYGLDTFYSDTLLLNRYTSALRPLITIVDFGTAKESEASITEANGKYDFLWIDHHPINGFNIDGIRHYISPWLTGGDSNITAGLVAACFAEMISGLSLAEFKMASLVSDHSNYADKDDKQACDMAMVIDALTVRPEAASGQRVTPRYIDGILGDSSKFEEILRDVKAQYAMAMDIGVSTAKQYTGMHGISVYVVDYKPIFDLNLRYVTKGKFSSSLQDEFEKKSGDLAVTIVHSNGSASIRMSKAIAPKIHIVDIIEEMKGEASYIDSGGGHNEAASVRTSREHDRELVGLLLSKLGVTRS